jgi:SAM-dependent methyltransferase
MYDYFLGGKDNYAVDRAAAEEVLSVLPEARRASWENRRFLQRAVRLLAGEFGIDQFVDIGTGLPTQGNVHEIAQEENLAARTVYVDYDPVVLVHARAILAKAGGPQTSVVEGDLRDPADILKGIEACHQIDFDRPVAILLVAVLHFITESDDPRQIIAQLRDAMAPGSHLVISHATAESRPTVVSRVEQVYDKVSAPIVVRTHAEITELFEGFELLDPGLVYVRQWRSDELGADHDPRGSLSLAGVGCKK